MAQPVTLFQRSATLSQMTGELAAGHWTASPQHLEDAYGRWAQVDHGVGEFSLS